MSVKHLQKDQIRRGVWREKEAVERMVAVGVEEKSLIGFIMKNSCGVMFQELQNIWDEIGEGKAEQDEVLLEIEKECLQVYQRKVDEANCTKAKLYKLVATKEAELAALMASLGEQTPYSQVMIGE